MPGIAYRVLRWALFSFAALPGMWTSAAAASAGKPVGKYYVTEVHGAVDLFTKEGTITALVAKTTYDAAGAAILTGPNASAALVFSNGSSLMCTAETRLRILQFDQAPMRANATDLDQEPSASQIQIFLAQGSVAVTTPALAAGSAFLFFTAQGQINIRNVQAVIDARTAETVVSLIAGTATARTDSIDAGCLLRPGEQVVLRNATIGRSEPLVAQAISIPELARLQDLAAESDMARRAVYFEPVAPGGSAGRGASPTGGGATGNGATNAGGTVSAFDNDAAPPQELKPVLLVPASLPVQFTVSPARIGR